MKERSIGLFLFSLIVLVVTVMATYRPIAETPGSHFKRYIANNALNGSYNPRNISNILAASTNPPKSPLRLSMLEVFFAQFINHDLERNEFVADLFYMPVYPGDPIYGVNASNNYIIARHSAGELVYDNEDDELRFEVFNNNTRWLDLSTIYGSDDATSAALRSYVDGKLKTSNYVAQLGPYTTLTFSDLAPNQAATGLTTSSPVSTGPATVMTSGDDRVDENIAMALINSAFIKRHNWWATTLSSQNASWDDQKLFEEARKMNIAEYQHIVFDEYLPVVLGPLASNLRKYRGYDDELDGRTSIEFASMAFRYGHSAVAPYDLIRSNGSLYYYTIPAGVFGPFPITSSQLPFAGQLGGPFNVATALATAGGIGNVLRGLTNTIADDVDLLTNNVVRNIVFGGSIGRGVDLFAIDILRARNNGATSYYELRKRFYNLKSLAVGDNNIYQACSSNKNDPAPDDISCFSLISSDLNVATALRNIYGKVTDIDGIVGLLAEDRYPGADFSRTTAGIILREYQTKRDADPWWYETVLTEEEIALVKNTTLSSLLSAVYNVSVQENVFVVPTAS